MCGEGCVAVCLRFGRCKLMLFDAISPSLPISPHISGRCKLMHEKFDATAAQLLDAVLAMQPTCPQDRSWHVRDTSLTCPRRVRRQPPDLTHGAWPLPHSQEERGKPCTTPFTVEELVQARAAGPRRCGEKWLREAGALPRRDPSSCPPLSRPPPQECGPLLEGHEFESDRRQLVANYLDTMCNDPLCMMATCRSRRAPPPPSATELLRLRCWPRL